MDRNFYHPGSGADRPSEEICKPVDYDIKGETAIRKKLVNKI
jgi:hypothetical protein